MIEAIFGLIIVIIVVLILYYFTPYGNEKFDVEPALQPLGENYQRRFNEIVDVNNVLNRPTRIGKEAIAKLGFVSDDNFAYIHGKPNVKMTVFRDPVKHCIDKNHPIYPLVEKLQPYMFGRIPHVIDGQFYYDWRYPEKPIDLKFAASPNGYCKLYPYRYPCTVRNSRIHLR